MRYIFFGSPEFAKEVLATLIEANLPPVALVCNPDKPVGRKKIITAPDTKQYILDSKLPIEIFQPKRVLEIEEALISLKPDFFIVAAYGQIIPKKILSLPPLGVLGVHPSLLPKYRGASPIQSALLEGESETGTTLFMVDEKVDHGPIVAREAMPIDIDETYISLEKKLARLGGELLIRTLPNFIKGGILAAVQNEEDATLTKKFETADAEIDFVKDSALSVYRKIQALNPEPGAYTMNYPGHEGKRVKLLAAALADGKVVPTQIQVEGKKPQAL